ATGLLDRNGGVTERVVLRGAIRRNHAAPQSRAALEHGVPAIRARVVAAATICAACASADDTRRWTYSGRGRRRVREAEERTPLMAQAGEREIDVHLAEEVGRSVAGLPFDARGRRVAPFVA